MKAICIALGLVFSPLPASAQVVISQAALDQLAGIAPAVSAAPAAPQIRPKPHRIAYRPAVRKALAPPPPPPPAAKPVSARIAPAPVARPVPASPAVAKPPPPPRAAVAFASGAADLPAGTLARLHPFCAASPAGLITIDAYAPAAPGDPSAAPRLSMARAFALRDALLACGVPPADIIARADGPGSQPDIAQIAQSP